MSNEKGLVFCHMCNQIVDDSFPTNHHHRNFGNRSGDIWLLEHGMTGFGWYNDTKKNRNKLAKQFPPRTKLEIEI